MIKLLKLKTTTLYFKGNLCLRQIDISFFPECLLCQININNKKKAKSGFYIDPLVKLFSNLTVSNIILIRF